MKDLTLALLLVLLVAPCSVLAAVETAPVPPGGLPNQNPVAICSDYDRIAGALLQLEPSADGEATAAHSSFLGQLDTPTAASIVSGAFAVHFTPVEAAELAGFLESPVGEAGIGIFSHWLLRGEFLKSPAPQELVTTWETFRATTAGIKLFAEVYTLYKEIAIKAVEFGGKLVVKAISSDIGKGAAVSILGSMMKSGAFFF